MKIESGKEKNYQFTDYIFEKTTVRYVIVEQKVFMLLLPNEIKHKNNDDYFTKKYNEDGFPNHLDWFPGSLVHLHLAHHALSSYENSLKYTETTKMLRFSSQELTEEETRETIQTNLVSEEGWKVSHILTHYKGENGFEIKSVFTNDSPEEVLLEKLTSASLDGLSPFSHDDGSESLLFHTFGGGWATEGKHMCRTLPEMNMEKSWGGSYECEKIGTIGSKTVGRFYPYAALEDTEAGCTWGIKLKHNATWQIELSRYGTPLSLSAGMADDRYGDWRKRVAPGESYESPVAYAAVAMGGVDQVSNDLLEMNNRDIDAYGEEGMPIIFNEWGTYWGNNSEEKLLSLARRLEGTKVKYFVMDDGWQLGGVGDWEVNLEKFPKGLKHYTDQIRAMGMVPGIWMEFECVHNKAKHYAKEYDSLYLTKDGKIIVNGTAKFLDLRKPEVISHLDEKVIRFLKENGIGYLKIDYNSTFSQGCDGADSLGEGLREQMEAVYQFLKKIKREIPDIIIENCASGGLRLEPKMLSAAAMGSFSDAIECMEVPVIAANMQYLISPRQSQVWCVLKDTDRRERLQYAVASGFLGRLCWSGFVDRLSEEQFAMIPEAEQFYEESAHIIKSGRSQIYRTRKVNYRALRGTQAVIRYSADRKEILAVCHFFDEPDELDIRLDGNYKIEAALYNAGCTAENGILHVKGTRRNAVVLRLRKV